MNKLTTKYSMNLSIITESVRVNCYSEKNQLISANFLHTLLTILFFESTQN
ncbi:hypothetical protein NIES4103_18390 [Nostoc sp. NIES-4103]|nr:hypothetical protein NIES4103_18390 [Nostoc sp. NIES-4103]